MNILDYSIFREVILPFVLVFVLLFALLQKSKLLGEGKAQIDALISLAVALILVITPVARDFIVAFMPWLAVAVSVILVFLLIYAFVGGSTSDKWVKVVFGILGGIFVIAVVIYAGGLWGGIKNFFTGESSNIWGNVIMVVIVLAVLFVAIFSKKN